MFLLFLVFLEAVTILLSDGGQRRKNQQSTNNMLIWTSVPVDN